MSKKFKRTPVLAAKDNYPRYRYTSDDEKYYDTPDEYGQYKRDYEPVYRVDRDIIEVPDTMFKKDRHVVIKDTTGKVILKDGYYPAHMIEAIYRYLPHWGFDVVKNIASDPNEIIVERNNYDGVEGATDMFGMEDSFFTKEELIEFADAVEDDVNEKFNSFNSPFSIQYNGIWMEDDNRTITIDYICFPNETQYSTSVKTDMRNIKAPGDIFKYVEKMANMIDQQIKQEEVTGSSIITGGDDYVGNLLPFGDEDGYYLVEAYAEPRFRGLMDDFASNKFDDAILKANEYANSGYYINIENLGSGEGKLYSPDEWLECIERTGEPPYSVYDLSDGDIEGSTSISCSSNIDELERIAHDVFNQVMSNRSRDDVNDQVIFDALKEYGVGEGDRSKLIDLVNENIDSYYNRGPFGEVQAKKYGNIILKAFDGMTISKRREDADKPYGLSWCANAIGLGTYQLLEALEGMCEDGRAYETSDSTYHVGRIR